MCIRALQLKGRFFISTISAKSCSESWHKLILIFRVFLLLLEASVFPLFPIKQPKECALWKFSAEHIFRRPLKINYCRNKLACLFYCNAYFITILRYWGGVECLRWCRAVFRVETTEFTLRNIAGNHEILP